MLLIEQYARSGPRITYHPVVVHDTKAPTGAQIGRCPWEYRYRQGPKVFFFTSSQLFCHQPSSGPSTNVAKGYSWECAQCILQDTGCNGYGRCPEQTNTDTTHNDADPDHGDVIAALVRQITKMGQDKDSDYKDAGARPRSSDHRHMGM